MRYSRLGWRLGLAGTMNMILLAILCLPQVAVAEDEMHEDDRTSLWVDALVGEPVSFEDMVADLVTCDVVFVGEHHTVARHHALAETIIEAMAAEGVDLALGMEMLEHRDQKSIDSYNRGELSFEGLAEAIGWSEIWPNFEDYRGIVAAAHRNGSPLLGLNAPASVVRQIARSGINGLDSESRALLPEDIWLDEPGYRARLDFEMKVHKVVDDSVLDRFFAAQVARDARMADSLASFLQSPAGRERTVVALMGAGHCAWFQGTVSRLQRRVPDARVRVVYLSESGDVVISEEMRRHMRDIEISHQQRQDMVRSPVADYLHVTEATDTGD